ncbi:MAG: DUF6090 family protein [Maribacter sp.]|nr:DUF6090 family protein [Maribacter sp.]
MIKLFRNIRRKLLAEGKTTNYLKYAIGEIVLVVLGILIALSINNWNEQRKTSKLEMELLRELNLNLNSNIEVFNGNIDSQKDIIKSIDLILDHLENKKPYNDSLAFHFRKLIYLEQITLSTSAYERLKSTGFDIIQSESLRMQIMQLFEMTYPSVVNLTRDVAMQRYSVSQSMLDKYFRTYRAQYAVPNNYSGLQNNQEFINWIYNRRAWKSSVIDFDQNLIGPTDALMKDVNIYLGD